MPRDVGAAGGAVATHAAPTTREAQRLTTRRSILDATVACLVDDGYGSLTTRRIAERAGIAQSTLMHHFSTRESLIVEAVAALAEQLAAKAIDELDLEALRGPAHRAAVLERAWATFTAPEALAAAQLWGAAWTEPELASALGELELRVAALVLSSAAVVFPDESLDPQFPVMIDGVVQMIRGLIMAIPTWGRETVEARWQALVPVLIDASNHLVAPPEVRGAPGASGAN
ncbi:MAG: TetR/AcrR family transcriptional regulator [Solirubrobacteraceae bacterium]